MKKTMNTFSYSVFKEMANIVESTSVAIDMIDNTPATHAPDFTMTAVRELLDAISGTCFELMLTCTKNLGKGHLIPCMPKPVKQEQ